MEVGPAVSLEPSKKISARVLVYVRSRSPDGVQVPPVKYCHSVATVSPARAFVEPVTVATKPASATPAPGTNAPVLETLAVNGCLTSTTFEFTSNKQVELFASEI